jgi:hypothetical protein
VLTCKRLDIECLSWDRPKWLSVCRVYTAKFHLHFKISLKFAGYASRTCLQSSHDTSQNLLTGISQNPLADTPENVLADTSENVLTDTSQSLTVDASENLLVDTSQNLYGTRGRG